MKKIKIRFWLAAGSLVAALAAGNQARAHCDTMGGAVAVEAMDALKKGKVQPLLKWVRPEDEAEVKEAFGKAEKARSLGPEARETADLYFIETLVRFHRASEGEPFTGLKPLGTALEPGIAEADEALRKGSVEELLNALDQKISTAVREKFKKAIEAGKHSNENTEKGRRYVAAYVDFLHTVERLEALLEAEEGKAPSEVKK